ncbi:integrator complex subunit 6-like isoform X2 [Mesocricetus auratus]|uniref:Integrator complex subunit 6-like isoform X2 n=1 Tax=Mesocricetus auratus TaxID=10036 RepID=A0ABM2XHX5_MESAU|nr:integrator complex subunit 6-like isoform X2 [Mesocricetus auratus]
MSKQKVSPVGEGEAMGPSPKKRYTMDMASNKSLEAPIKAKGEGATVIQKAQVGTMEGDSKSPKVYLKECDENQLNPVAGEAILPSPRGSLPDDSLHRKDDVTVAGGSVSRDNSADTATAPATPSSEAGPYVSPRNRTVTNYEIKHALMSEIRRYGRQYGRIFKLLEEVQGPLEARKELVEFTIKEAARFKRHHLIHYLKEILEKLMPESSLKNDDLHPSV